MVQSNKVEIVLSLKDRATQGLKKSTRAIKDNREALRKGSILAAGAAGILGGVIFKAAQAEREQERAEAALSQALKLVGVNYEDVRKEVEATTAALQAKTNFGDEEQISALQTLVSIGGEWEDSLAALPAVLDVAAGAGLDLEAAALLVGKAMAGETGTLSRYGILLDEGATKTEVMTAIMEKFAGQAEAQADPLKQMTNALGDMLEKLQVRDVIEQVAQQLRFFAEFLQKNLTPAQLKAIGAALVIAFAVFTAGAVVAGIVALVNPITLVVVGIAALVAGIIIVWKNWDRISKLMSEIFRSKWAWLLPHGPLIKGILWIKDNWDAIWGAIKTTFNTVSGALKRLYTSKLGWILPGGPLIKAILFLKDNWDTVWGGLEKVATTVFDNLKAVAKGVVGVLLFPVKALVGVVQSAIDRIPDKLKRFIPGLGDIAGFIASIGGAIKEFTDPVATATGGVEKFATGGIVRRPTLAMIGEAGPEAVVPLNGVGGLGGNITVVMPPQGVVVLNNESSVRALANQLMPFVRSELRSQRDF